MSAFNLDYLLGPDFVNEVYLEKIDPKKNNYKFYRISVNQTPEESYVQVNYGRIGSTGSFQRKYASKDIDMCRVYMTRLKEDKIKKGYVVK